MPRLLASQGHRYWLCTLHAAVDNILQFTWGFSWQQTKLDQFCHTCHRSSISYSMEMWSDNFCIIETRIERWLDICIYEGLHFKHHNHRHVLLVWSLCWGNGRIVADLGRKKEVAAMRHSNYIDVYKKRNKFISRVVCHNWCYKCIGFCLSCYG